MEDTMKEFVAYSKKLLRALRKIRALLDVEDIEEAKILLDELIEDTESDIQA